MSTKNVPSKKQKDLSSAMARTKNRFGTTTNSPHNSNLKKHLKNKEEVTENQERDKQEIDNLIAQTCKNRKYSHSFIGYKPLTKWEKVKAMEEMNENSTLRFQHYTQLFDQIKTQINDINNSLSGSLVKENNTINAQTKPKNRYAHSTEDYIEEKDEENYPSPTHHNKRDPKFTFNINWNTLENNENTNYNIIPKPNKMRKYKKRKDDFDDTFDPVSLNEGTQGITIHSSPVSELLTSTRRSNRNSNNENFKLNLLKISMEYSNNLSWRNDDENLFYQAKNEIKRWREKNKSNRDKEFEKNFYFGDNKEVGCCSCGFKNDS